MDEMDEMDEIDEIDDYLKKLQFLIDKVENSEEFKSTEEWEIKEKIRIYKSSLDILKKYKKHPLIKFEIFYQRYRTSFSECYFSMSDWYRGDSFIQWKENRPMRETYKEAMRQVACMILMKNLLKIE